MASFVRHGDLIICISGNLVAVYNIGSDEKKIYACERQEKDDRSIPDGSDKILAHCLSPSGKYFATCDDWKQLTLWETAGDWVKKSVRPVVRRGTAITFTKSETELMVADKSGDVYSFSTSCAEEEGKLLMGHLSMLLDITLCGPEQVIATADRDEKIRVSHFPNAYNILTYCLGHTKAVTKLLYLEKQDCLVSGGGDGTLRLWNYRSGESLCSVNCQEHLDLPQKSAGHLPDDKNMVVTEGTDEDVDMERTDQETKLKDVHMQQTEEEETKEKEKNDDGDVAVQCLTCDAERGLLAVSFQGLPQVLIYHLQRKNVADTPRVTFLQRINTVAPPWELCLHSATLMLLQPLQQHTVAVYAMSSESQNFAAEELTGDIKTTIDAINSDWDFFKASLQVESKNKVLQKWTGDGSKDQYFIRKQQRLEQKQQGTKGGKRKSKRRRDKAKRHREEETKL